VAKLSADGTTAIKPTVYSKDWHEATVKMVTQKGSKSGGVFISVGWKPDKGEDANNFSYVFDNVMVSGNSAAGNPLRTDRLFDYLDALNAPRDYTCCSKVDSQSKFEIKDGKYYCPHCGAQPQSVLFDPVLWENRRARIKLDIGKAFQSDDSQNEVKAVAPLATP
jgi:hypothetical protein